jgi:type IV fimbrial biogenesis protein FimT
MQPARSTRPRSHRSASGFTLLECMLALAVAAIVVSLSVPGFGAARARRHVEGAAAQVQTDMELARSEAVRTRRAIHLRFNNAGGNCYLLYTGPLNSCSCTAAGHSSCITGSQPLRTQTLDREGVQLQSNVNTMTFDPVQGTVTPTGTVRLEGRENLSLRVIVSLLGRIRTCTPSVGMPGYKRC